jgi:hypothetical protein
MAQQLNDQGVHLTRISGKMFVDTILMTAEAFLIAENIDFTMEDSEMSSVQGPLGLLKGVQST